MSLQDSADDTDAELPAPLADNGRLMRPEYLKTSNPITVSKLICGDTFTALITGKTHINGQAAEG